MTNPNNNPVKVTKNLFNRVTFPASIEVFVIGSSAGDSIV